MAAGNAHQEITMRHAVAIRHTLSFAVLLAAPWLAMAGPLNKCVQGQTVVYSDKPCPEGVQANSVTGGSISTTDSLPMPRQSDYSSYYYYQGNSGRPQVPYLSKQKSVEESLRERSLRR
jgi:hypothetical protein